MSRSSRASSKREALRATLSRGVSDRQSWHAVVHVTWPPAYGISLRPVFTLKPNGTRNVFHIATSIWDSLSCSRTISRLVHASQDAICQSAPNLHSMAKCSQSHRDNLPYQEDTLNFDALACQMMSRLLLPTNMVKHVCFLRNRIPYIFLTLE